jgi:hypothetical protein
MTLLGAAKADSSVYVAADSLQTWATEGYGSTVDKLYQLHDLSVVWGFHGNVEAGMTFQKHVDNYTPGSWGEVPYFYEQAAGMLVREYFNRGGFGALFGGCLGGEWAIRAFGPNRLETEDSCFVGNNRLAAHVGWKLAAAIPNELSQEDRLGAVMQNVIDASSPFLSAPLNMWRITPSECVRCV